MGRTFAFDWRAGYIAPFRGDGDETYTTPPEVIESVLDKAAPFPGGLCDLGAGDGRFCVAAARRGVRAVGIELDASLCAVAEAAARDAGVASLVEIRAADLLVAPIDVTTAVAYLLPAALQKVAPTLASRDVQRLITVRWPIPDPPAPLVLTQTWSVPAPTAGPWTVYEYDCAPISPEAEPPAAPPVRPEPPAPASFEEDAGDEWLDLQELFETAPLAPPRASSLTFRVSAALPPLRLAPKVGDFLREGGAPSGAVGIGADRERCTGALVWDSSLVLATYLARHHGALLPRGARCVELGAGLGLVGLTAAALGYPATLTDRAEQLPALREGVAANSLGALASVAELAWGDDAAADALADGGVGCVCAADCIYEASSVELLLRTLARLATPRTVVLVAYDEALARWEAYRRFEEQAPREFEVEAVADGDDADAEAPPALSKPTVRLFRLRRREG